MGEPGRSLGMPKSALSAEGLRLVLDMQHDKDVRSGDLRLAVEGHVEEGGKSDVLQEWIERRRCYRGIFPKINSDEQNRLVTSWRFGSKFDGQR